MVSKQELNRVREYEYANGQLAGYKAASKTYKEYDKYDTVAGICLGASIAVFFLIFINLLLVL